MRQLIRDRAKAATDKMKECERTRGGTCLHRRSSRSFPLCGTRKRRRGRSSASHNMHSLLLFQKSCYSRRRHLFPSRIHLRETKGETSIIGKVDAKSVCPSTVLATNVIESVQPSDYLRTVNERDCCCLFFYGLSRDLVFPLSFVSLLLQSSSSRTLLSL